MRRLLLALVLPAIFLFTTSRSKAQCSSTITSFPYEEGFEDGFNQWTGDIANPGWQTNSNGTASGGTGPSAAAEGADYAYTETSQGGTGVQDSTLTLNGPCFDLPSNSLPFFAFSYHMYTSGTNTDMGYFYLLADINGAGSYDTLWSKFGNQGNAWLVDTIDLSAYAGDNIRLSFVGITGTSNTAWRGDRAIDDLYLSTGVVISPPYCQGGSDGSAELEPIFGNGPYTYSWSSGGSSSVETGLSGGTYTVTITDSSSTAETLSFVMPSGLVPLISGNNYAESFETSLSPWFNDSINDDFDWTRNSGGTPTGPTGPGSANDGVFYVYTESSFLNDNDQAILVSPCFDLDSMYLPYFVFDYHMRVQGFGGSNSDMGITWIIADTTPTTNLTGDTLWTQNGATGNNWLSDSIDLTPYVGSHLTLRIVGELSAGIQQYGDRGFDNFKIKDATTTSESCDGATGGSISLNPQFGNSPYTYSWSTGATSSSISNLATGTYTVTITDNSSTSYIRSIEVITSPLPTATTSISSTVGEFCSNNLGTDTLSIQYLDSSSTYSVTSSTVNDLGPQNTIGQPIDFSIQGNHPFATGDGVLTIYYRGDIEAPGEFVNTLSENGIQIGTANAPAQQCAGFFVASSFTLSADSINSWIADGDFELQAVPVGMTRYCGTGGTRFSLEAYYTLTYDFSPFEPYWFEDACDTVIANAIDSGYTVEVSPTTTTTYYVRNYYDFCQTWGPCQSITIDVNTPPTVSISPPNPFYCSTPITITASGASTYAWSPGAGLNQSTGASVNASPASTTNYQVIGTDVNTCADTLNFTVTVTTGPSASVSSTNVSCNAGNDGSATVTASGGSGSYTYSWSNGGTTATVNSLSAGTYTVTVDDGTTCQAIQSVTISEPNALSITIAGNNIGCNGFSTGSAFAFVSGGTSPYSYLWSNGSTSNVVFALAAGTYTLTVTDDNSCTETETVTITQPSSPLSSSITSTTNVSCFGGNDGSATAAGSGGTPGYSYAWSSGANTATANNLSAGSYIVTVSDTNGCQSVSIATITEPATAVSVSISSSTDVTCNGGNDGSATASGSGGTGSISYLWSSGANTATASSLSAGVYTVTATDDNGCTDTAQVTISQPPAVSATFSITNVSCNGGSDGSITATGTGGDGGPFSFVWSSGGSAATETGLSAGTYTVTITDNSGCTGTASASVTEPSALIASISTSTNVSCNGDNDGSATAAGSGGTSPYTYSWNTGGTSATENNLSAGTYSVTVTDDNGCTDSSTVTITEPTALTASTSVNNNVSCFGGSDGSATLTAGGGTSPYTYSWSSGGNAATETGLSAGTYTVTVTDDNSCTETATVSITEPATAVSANITGSTNVSCNGGTDGSATVAASGGTSPYTYLWSSGGTSTTESGLGAGTYTVTVTDDNGCTDTDQVTITEPAALTASTSVTNTSCNGGNDGTATVTPSGGTSPYTYSWSSGGTAVTETGLSAGIYTVTVTDDNSCTTTATATITEPTPVVASISSSTNVSCNGDSDGSATAAGSGGTSPYTFSWNTGGTSATENNLSAGTYSVTVTDDNGCTDSSTVTITEPTALTASTSVNNNVSCFGGSDGSATVTAGGGTSPYTYSWSSGGSAATETGLSAGTYTVTVTDDNSCTTTATATITEPATAVSANITGSTNVSCNGGNDGSATVAASGGTSPYTYLWSSGGTSTTESGLSAGTYTVTVTDDNGCTDTDQVTITEPAALTASTSVTNTSCNGGNDGTATVTAGGGTSPYSYSWSSGGTFATETGLSAGTYTVTVTDDNSCTTTATATITEPTLVVASISSSTNVSCNGDSDGSATAAGSGGTSPYTYSWNTGGTSATENNLSAGTYSVTVTDDNGCTDSSTVTITEPAAITASTTVNNNVSCFGGSNGSATVTAGGGTSPYTYSWSSGGSAATETGLSAGTYTVTVTDDNSCTTTATATITEPATAVSANITGSTNLSCNGGNDGSATVAASGGTSPYTYLWSSGGTSTTESGLSAGTYTVTVTDDNGCTDTDQVTITEPAALTASTSVTNTSCNGGNDGTATVTAGGGTSPYSYSWSSGGTFATETGLSAGTYTVTVTDDNSCTTTATATITEPTLVVASISSSTNVSCNGDSDGSATAAGSGGTSPYTYSWNTGGTSATENNLSAGTYSVTVTDDNGCTDSSTVTITEPTALTASTSVNNNVSCFGGSDGSATVTAGGGTSPYTYSWSSGGSAATETGLSAGTYTVTVTDNNSCTETATVTITEPATAVLASITGSTNVSCNGGNDGSATVTASGGTPTYTYAWSSGGTSTTETGLSAGTYSVTVTDNNGCTDSASVTITEPTPLVASSSVNNNVSCNGGNDGSVTASATGGTPAYTYSWNTGATTATETGLSAGTYSVTITDNNGCTDSSTVTITEPTLLVASIVLDSNVSCNGGNDGSATAAASGGTSPYTYSWNTGGTSATENNLSAGTYSVTVTDDNGCTDSSTVTITEPAALTATTAVINNVSCFGGNDGSASVTAGGGTSPYTYAWSSGGSATTENNLSAGTYTVTVTDDNSCTETATVTITEPASAVLASIALDSNVSCNGGTDGSATASASGGTAPYTYAWSNGPTTASNPLLSAGTYTVTVTDDNGCTDSTSITITEPTLLVATITGSSNVSCNGGNDGSATVNAVGGTTPYTYAWNSGGTATTETGLSAGTYTVTVTDDNGCTALDTVIISEPAILSAAIDSSNNVSCNGLSDGEAFASANGGTSPYTFAWNSGQTIANPNDFAAGSYTVTITDNNGCTDTAQVTITEPAILDANIDSVHNVSCNGLNDGAAFASGNGGTAPYSYAWSSGSNNFSSTGLGASTFTVTVTDDNGCTDTAQVTITEPAALSATATLVQHVSCFGGSNGIAQADVSGGTLPYTYTWSSGGVTDTAAALSAGVYTVTVTDDNGCTDTSSITITEPAPITATASTTTNVSCNGLSDGAVTASGSGGTSPYFYTWSTGATSASVTGLPAGTYTVSITDSFGCAAGVDSTVITQPDTLLANLSSSNISCNGANDGTLTSTPSGGTTPYTYSWSTSASTATISNLSTGVYTVTVTDSNGCTTSSSMIITQPVVFSASASVLTQVSCFGGNDGSAFAVGTGGTLPYSFLWSNGPVTDTILNLTAGNYTVTLTDSNGCQDSTSIIITEPTVLSASASIVSPILCNGDSNGSVMVNATGGTSPYSFLWSNGVATALNDSIATNTYTVTVTDNNGCTDTVSINISEPAVLAIVVDSITDVSCYAGGDGEVFTNTSGGTTPYSYLWSNGSTTGNVSALSANTYTVTVTDANGCTAAIAAFVQEPDSISNTFTVENASCFGSLDAYLVANPTGGTSPFSYLWSNALTADSIGGLGAGTYTVTITDDNGCTNSFSATLTEPAALVASIILEDSVNCAGDSTGIAIAAGAGGTSPYSYAWPSGFTASNDSLLGLPIGNYTVTITDDNGCTDTAVAQIDGYPAIVSNLDSLLDVNCFNGSDGYASISVTGGAGGFSYLWPDGGTASLNDSLTAGTHCVTITDGLGCTDTLCVTLGETNTLPLVDLGSDTALCDTTFTLDAGTAVSYAWSNAATSQTIQVNASGLYTVTITDTNGCSNADTIDVEFFPYLSFDIDVDSTQCTTATAEAQITNLTGGGGFTYNWSNGESGAPSIDSLALGVYGVTVADTNGCSAVDSFEVFEDSDLAFAFVSGDVSCFGLNDGFATTAITGGLSPFNYNWSNGGVNDSILNLSAGVYTLTLTDSAGCERTDSLIITQPDQVTFNLATVNADCGDSNGYAAVIDLLPAGSYSFAWNDPMAQTTDTAFTLPAGLYTVTVTASNGCTDTAQAIISNNGAPALTMSAINESCAGTEDGIAIANATSASPLTYVWNDPMAQTTDSATNLSPGLYFVTVADTAGCLVIDSISVGTDNPLPIVELGPDTTLCANLYTLDAGAGQTAYIWNTGSITDTINVSASGTYTVTVTSPAGCINSDSVVIDLNTPPVPDLGGNKVACQGSELILTAGGGYSSYFWSTGATTPSIVASGSQAYSLTVTTSAGCSGSDSVSVSFVAPPVLDLGPDTVVCIDDFNPSLTLDAGDGYLSYLWNTSDTTQSISANTSGMYAVTVSNAPECFGSDQKIVVFDTCINVPVEDLSGLGAPQVLVYPNPTRGRFTIETRNLPNRDHRILLTNARGQIVNETNVTTNEGAIRKTVMDMSNAPKGLYMMIIEGEGFRIDKRLIIQ